MEVSSRDLLPLHSTVAKPYAVCFSTMNGETREVEYSASQLHFKGFQRQISQICDSLEVVIVECMKKISSIFVNRYLALT